MNQPFSTPSVPKKYSGKWIAWDFDRTRIVASGTTFAEAKQAAQAAGETRPILAKVPRSNVRVVKVTACR
jgi:hypothetical protein